MIPRTKVNYTWRELLNAALVSERTSQRRTRLTERLCHLFGFERVLLTPSGRGALYFLLRSLPQERVLLPAYTCKAVVEAARLANKRVEHVEMEPNSFNMDIDALAATLDADAAVIATHQFGIPCDITRIQELCRSHRAFLVEDVAAAFGTRIDGRLAGTFGDAAFFSFDSTKLINVPLKAGFLSVRDQALFASVQETYLRETRAMSMHRKAALLCQGATLLLLEHPAVYRVFHKLMFEWRGRFTNDGPGLSLILTPFYRDDVPEWQAYLALEQLARLDDILDKRRRLYADLHARLSTSVAFDLPPRDPHGEWACVRFPIRVRGDKLAYYRRGTELGLDFAFSFTFIDCPQEMLHAQRLAASVLNVPYYFKLSDREVSDTVRILKEILPCE